MENNIENLEKVLDNNQEYVYVNANDTKNMEETSLINKITDNIDREGTSYDTDETRKETSLITEDDCNDSVLTLNKEDENDNSEIINENERIEVNEDNETHVNVENIEKYK